MIGIIPAIIAVSLMATMINGQKPPKKQDVCKAPTVAERLMADDVRFASPFYIIALPRNEKTQQIDNVCYTYFESENKGFFHIISVTFNNGSNEYYTFTKSDIPKKIGLAEGKADDKSMCTYHDYTLTPICNVSVFMLYRCYLLGECKNIDIGKSSGVDVRVVIAASPQISDACSLEVKATLKDTSSLVGDDYVFLPQKRKPKCVTKYLGKPCINAKNAIGSIEVSDEDVAFRFSENSENLEFSGTTAASARKKSTQGNQRPIDLFNSNHESTTVVSTESTAPLYSSQPTVQTTPPRRSYADVLKTPTKTIQPTKGGRKA